MGSDWQVVSSISAAIIGAFGTLLVQWRLHRRQQVNLSSIKSDLEVAALLADGPLKEWTKEYARLRLRALFDAETRKRDPSEHPVAMTVLRSLGLLLAGAYLVGCYQLWDESSTYERFELVWSGTMLVAGGTIVYLYFQQRWIGQIPLTGLRRTAREAYQAELQELRSRLIEMRAIEKQADVEDTTREAALAEPSRDREGLG